MTGELPFGSNKQEELVDHLIKIKKLTPANYPPSRQLSPVYWNWMTMCWDLDPLNHPQIIDLLKFLENATKQLEVS